MAAAKVISLAEIEGHNTTESCFMSIHGKVYDVTKFLVEVRVVFGEPQLMCGDAT